jgi:hypothetical protein
LALDGTNDRVQNGRAVAEPTVAGGSSDVATDEEYTFLGGSLLDHSVSLGLAPWVNARVGLGGNTEAGLTYTGRSVRGDGRHAFETPFWALSIGGGLTALFLDPAPNATGPGAMMPEDGRLHPKGFEFGATGFGVDLPVLVGYRPEGTAVLEFWGGVRLGFERLYGELPLTEASTEPAPLEFGETASAEANRFQTQALLGMSVGVRPVWLRIETAFEWHRMTAGVDFPQSTGEPRHRSFEFSIFTLAPAAAAVVEF